MTHLLNNTLFRNIKYNFPSALIALIISFASIHPAIAISENIEIHGYHPELQVEDTSDTDDCD